MTNCEDNVWKSKKIAVFGCGAIFNSAKKKLEQLGGVTYYFDNHSAEMQPVDGKTVLSPSKLPAIDFDVIFITCKAVDEIREQIHSLNITDERILTYKDLDGILFEISQKERGVRYLEYLDAHRGMDREKKIVLISNELSFTGAVSALYYMAQILRKHDFEVALVSILPDMGMGDYYRKLGIEIFEEPYYQYDNQNFWNFLDGFGTVVANTMILEDMIPLLGRLDARCIWWIHESDERCDSLKKISRDSLPANLEVYGVGERPLKAVKYIWGEDFPIHSLLYGIPDRKKGYEESVCCGKIIFALVGSLYRVKGQDLFVEAIKGLKQQTREKAEFLVIGRVLHAPTADIVKKAEEEGLVEFKGELSRTEMDELYDEIHVVVVPSRRDTMPVVAAEGMMNSKLCIVSDVTGTAAYIRDGANGFTFPKENVEELRKYLQNTIECYDSEEYREIRKKSRETFERYFSMEAFEKNLAKIFRWEE